MAADEMTGMPDVIGDLRTWFQEHRAMLTDHGLTAGYKDSPTGRGDVGSGNVAEEHREITSQIGMRDATETLLASLQQS